jgi:Protein of unknown function (DUF1571)
MTQSCCSRSRFTAWMPLVAILLVVGWIGVRSLVEGGGETEKAAGPVTVQAMRPTTAELESHPLAQALEFARRVQSNLENNVRDYTATLIKQERIAGQLNPEEVAFIKVRNQPFSVYMKFLAPEDLKGQEALYVEGANEGNLLGHAGSGAKALIGTVSIPPTGPIAMFGQRYPITELGLANLVQRLIEVGEHDEQLGECSVWQHDDAKVGDRPCISFTVLHPTKRAGLLFHIARIFVDKELMVPLHYEAYDWPEKPGEPPPLLEQYTYARLRMNPGLTDDDFDQNNPAYNFVKK